MNASSRKAAAALFTLALAPCVALADTVTQWNQNADSATATLFPALKFRVMAMVHGAVHDALNAVEARYEPYHTIAPAAPGASPHAAAGAAAYRVLSQVAPSAAVDAMYAAWLLALPPCPAAHPDCITTGLATGTAAADAMVAARATDGSAAPHLPYTNLPGPGVHERTPPNFPTPSWAGWALVEPFVVGTATQFRPDPPDMLDLTHEDYTRDFNEVKRVGDVNAEALGNRTATQSATARFIAGGGFPPNLIARQVLATRDQGLWGNARLLAVLNMALHDATVTMFEAKYYYAFWRPITAIRAADTDGNPDTVADPGWLSYLTTPPYPDFPSGLCSHVGTTIEVLSGYFGTHELGFTATAAGITRSYTNLRQAEADAVDARVFGGIHFRTADVYAVRMGEHVGRFVLQHALRPEKGRGH